MTKRELKCQKTLSLRGTKQSVELMKGYLNAFPVSEQIGLTKLRFVPRNDRVHNNYFLLEIFALFS